MKGVPEPWSAVREHDDHLDVPLTDAEMAEEVALTVTLIVAANEWRDGRIPQREIDRILFSPRL